MTETATPEALVASLYAALDAEEAAAKAALGDIGNWGGTWTAFADDIWKRTVIDADGIADHLERQDPARTLRRVAAHRDLIAAILAEEHQEVGDPWYSCAQAARDGEEPGSACVDENRAGGPCDCGRDARVTRLLGIIATIYEEPTT